MIFFVTMHGLEAGCKPLQDDPAAPEVRLIRYDEILGKPCVPRGTYIFTDFEGLNTAELIEAARLFHRLQENDCRALNDPARARSRFALLRTLHRAGINVNNAYLAEEGERPNRFPVFIRVADDHRGSLSELIWDQSALDSVIEAAVVAGFPRSTILITEYAAEPIRPGVFRKSSVYRVGEQLIPDIWWYGTNWEVKGDRDGLADAQLYQEELDAMRDGRFVESFRESFALANIEYGRLDFSFVEGKPCVYEINSFPALFGPRTHRVPERVESINLRWDRLRAAFHEIDTDVSRELVDVAGTSIKALRRSEELSQALRYRHLRLSREYIRRENFSEALVEAKAEVAEHPNSAEALSQLSWSLRKCNRIDDAIAVATRVIELSPRRIPDRLNVAKFLHESGHYDVARDRLLEGLALGSAHWRVYFLLAQVYSKLGNDEAALDAANQAAELAPDAPNKAGCLSYVGRLLTTRGLAEDAIVVFARAVQLNPRRKNERLRLINLLRQTGGFEEARSQLLDGLVVHGEHWKLYFLLSGVYRKLGDHAAALETATRATKLAPQEVRAAAWLSRLENERTSP